MAIKYMDIGEFASEGYLQEVNRQFFHPLGMALVLSVEADEETGEELGPWKLAGIWDARDDPEGIIFSDGVIDPERSANVTSLQETRREKRETGVGYWVQPVGEKGASDTS